MAKQSFRNQNSGTISRQQDCKSHRILITHPGVCKDYFQNIKGDIFIFLFYFFINLFYLFLAALGLCYCMQAFSSCGKWGLLSAV